MTDQGLAPCAPAMDQQVGIEATAMANFRVTGIELKVEDGYWEAWMIADGVYGKVMSVRDKDPRAALNILLDQLGIHPPNYKQNRIIQGQGND